MHRLIETLQTIEHLAHAAKPTLVAVFLAALTAWELGRYLWTVIAGE